MVNDARLIKIVLEGEDKVSKTVSRAVKRAKKESLDLEKALTKEERVVKDLDRAFTDFNATSRASVRLTKQRADGIRKEAREFERLAASAKEAAREQEKASRNQGGLGQSTNALRTLGGAADSVGLGGGAFNIAAEVLESAEALADLRGITGGIGPVAAKAGPGLAASGASLATLGGAALIAAPAIAAAGVAVDKFTKQIRDQRFIFNQAVDARVEAADLAALGGTESQARDVINESRALEQNRRNEIAQLESVRPDAPIIRAVDNIFQGTQKKINELDQEAKSFNATATATEQLLASGGFAADDAADSLMGLADETQKAGAASQSAQKSSAALASARQSEIDVMQQQLANQEKLNAARSKFQEDLASLASETGKRQKEINADVNKQVAEANRETAQAVQESYSQLNKDLEDAEDEYNKNVLKARKDFEKEDKRIREDFAKQKNESATNLDAIAFKQAQESEKEALKENEDNLKETLDNEKESYQERQRELKKAQREEVFELKKSNRERISEIRADGQEQLAELKQNNDEKAAELNQAFIEEKKQYRDHFQQLSQITAESFSAIQNAARRSPGGSVGASERLTSSFQDNDFRSRFDQRARGGPVSAGQLYQVNERRHGQPQVEFFRPNTGGHVISLGSNGGAGGINMGDVSVIIQGSTNMNAAQIENAVRKGMYRVISGRAS